MSTGEVQLVFAPDGRENGTDGDDAPLRDSEILLMRWVVEHELQMRDAILECLLARYGNMRDATLEFLVDPELMPPIKDVAGFKRLLELHTVFVHPIESRGMPYAGFQFHCSWEGEHGLGVLMNGVRCVEVDGADIAFTVGVARRDADRFGGSDV